MTSQQYLIQRKLNMLELGSQLGNISDACRKLGVSRQHSYDIRNAIREEGLEGLLEKTRSAPRLANRVAPEIEAAVLQYSDNSFSIAYAVTAAVLIFLQGASTLSGTQKQARDTGDYQLVRDTRYDVIALFSERSDFCALPSSARSQF